jgi:Mn2+/Fe2+ NRAMP family transporter
VLLASRKRAIVGEYAQPIWLQVAGWLVVMVMAVFSVQTVAGLF